MRELSHCKTGEYDKHAAGMLCECAGLAYAPFDHALAAYARQGYSLTRTTSGSMSCDVATGDGATVVAFAGTNDVEDWLTNLNLEKVDWNGYRLHAGFHKAEANLTLRLSRQYTADTSNLWITGHSLGGILATLHALRFADGFGDQCVSGVYTFGSPRGMDHRSAAMCDQLLWKRHYRHTHGNDIVPRVPTRWRFKHCGQHVHINRHGAAVHHPSPLALLIDRVLGFRFDMLRNHFCEKYLIPLQVARFE